ncbi:MAG: enoyl-CoA hydratase-related protein [Roseobacter sp.]
MNRLVSHEDLMPATFDLAERILRHSPPAAARIITAVTRGINSSITEGLEIESEQFGRMVATNDISEGLDAWITRRAPRYLGT